MDKNFVFVASIWDAFVSRNKVNLMLVYSMSSYLYYSVSVYVGPLDDETDGGDADDGGGGDEGGVEEGSGVGLLI